MRVEIWSDLVCPWCYIGKRRFERALELCPDRDAVEVVHRSFQLDPTAARGSVQNQREVLMRKYGLSAAQADAMDVRMSRMAAEEGLEFDRMNGLIGNTLDAHRLVHLASAHGLGDQMIERLYRAHFTEQRSLFDHDSLVELAVEAGLDRAEARRALTDQAYTAAIAADIEDARTLGVSGVPFFVIDGKYGISGAQPMEVFVDALKRA